METLIADNTIIDDGSLMVLTTDHPASSYGIPVLLDKTTGQIYGPADNVTSQMTDNSAAHYVRSEARIGGFEDDALVVKFLSVKY